MRFYRNPKWFRRAYPDAIWDFSFEEHPTLYLTFDDGPDSETTEELLSLLARFNAKATFFCSGENVLENKDLYAKIIEEGHQIGSHGMKHLKGWKTSNETYLSDVKSAQKIIDSSLFRPPYGKLRPKQFKAIKELGYMVVFWSLMSYDFDKSQTIEELILKMKKHCQAGDIIVFHDKVSCQKTLTKALPELLEFWSNQGFKFAGLNRLTT